MIQYNMMTQNDFVFTQDTTTGLLTGGGFSLSEGSNFIVPPGFAMSPEVAVGGNLNEKPTHESTGILGDELFDKLLALVNPDSSTNPKKNNQTKKNKKNHHKNNPYKKTKKHK